MLSISDGGEALGGNDDDVVDGVVVDDVAVWSVGWCLTDGPSDGSMSLELDS